MQNCSSFTVIRYRPMTDDGVYAVVAGTDCQRVPRAKISRASTVMRRTGSAGSRLRFGERAARNWREVSMAMFVPGKTPDDNGVLC
jgi:hypothetical protein